MLHKLHDHEDVVQAAAHHHLTHIHDVLVVEAEQDVDLPDRGQGEAICLLVQLDLLQRADSVGLLVPRSAPAAQDTVTGMQLDLQAGGCGGGT